MIPIQRDPRTLPTSGFTLVEVSIMLGVMAIVMVAMGSIIVKSQNFFLNQMSITRVDEIGLRLMDRLSRDLRPARADTVLPTPLQDSPTISYQQVVSFQEDGTPLLGPVTSVSFSLVSSEQPNGLDDNGDGRVDEGQISVTAGGLDPVVVTSDVTGLRFTSGTDSVTFELDVLVLDIEDNLTQKTFTRRIAYRN